MRIKLYHRSTYPAITHPYTNEKILSIKPTHPSIDGCNKEWVIIRSDGTIRYGKILKKISLRCFTYQHWNKLDGSDLLVKCTGCDNSSNGNNTNSGTCIKRALHSKATVIRVEILIRTISGASYKIITSTELVKTCILISLSAQNNENTLISVDIPILDHNLISRLFNSSELVQNLIYIW